MGGRRLPYRTPNLLEPFHLEKRMMNDYLNHLAGSWDLTGRMGSTELHQKVEAHWVLQGLFLQMHFLQQDAPAPGRSLYEAIYMLGYDEKTDVYVMHLFDTFGVSYAITPGMGQRQGDSVEFIFDYPEGPFSNTFSWVEASGQWEMLLRAADPEGGWRVFATKTLTRA